MHDQVIEIEAARDADAMIAEQARIDAGVDSYIASFPLPTSMEEAIQERDFWIREACRFGRNEDYYRGLVDQIGALFGEAAYIADDGSRSHDILRAKVPELAAAELKELREKVGAMREALCAAEIVMASIIGRGGVAEGGEQNGNMVDLVAAYSHVATALGQALSPKPPKLSGYQQAVKDVQEAIAEGGDREQ